MKITNTTNHKSALSLFKRYNLVIFIAIIALALSVATLVLYSVVNKASGENSTPDSSLAPSSFDQETIDRINRLKTPDQPSDPLDFSQGRINPFYE